MGRNNRGLETSVLKEKQMSFFDMLAEDTTPPTIEVKEPEVIKPTRSKKSNVVFSEFAPLQNEYSVGDRLKVIRKPLEHFEGEWEAEMYEPFIGKIGQFVEVSKGTKRSALYVDMGKQGVHVFNENEVIQL